MAAQQQSSGSERTVKTLAIRLDTELHARLSVIAQLRGNTVTDEIREALSAHVAAQAANQDLAGSAAALLEDIEQEAASRRDALSALFGSTDSTPAKPSRRTSSGGKASRTPAANAEP